MSNPGHKSPEVREMRAHIATTALSGHMRNLAVHVSADPKSFSPDDAAKLRNAAQVAQTAADLIDGGIKYERRSTNN